MTALGILLVLAVAGYWALGRSSGATTPQVSTAPVVRGSIEDDVLATGTVKPVKLVAVGAQVSGRVNLLKVKVGDRVKAGDLIAEIDSQSQANAVETSKAQLAQVEAQRRENQATVAYDASALARQAKTLAQKASSQADYDAAAQALAVAKAQGEALAAQVAAAKVAVKTAQINLGYTRITAPISGTVLAVVTQAGQTVNANQTAPTIVVLGELDRMKVDTQISEADVTRVKPGMPVWFTTLGDTEKRYRAHLGAIDPAPQSVVSDPEISAVSASSTSSSNAAVYYNGSFDVSNPNGALRTYMTAEVHIVLGQASNVLMIPSSALSRRNKDGTWNVKVLAADGKIVTRAVRIGLDNKVDAEVLSGLTAGERVVTGELISQVSSSSGSHRPHGPMGF